MRLWILIVAIATTGFWGTSPARAQNVTWTFTGTYLSVGNFTSPTEGSGWELAIEIDPDQVGSGGCSGGCTVYVGNASFTSEVNAGDTSAEIAIYDAPNAVEILLQDPGATLPQLPHPTIPPVQVEFIRVTLDLGGTGSEDLSDYLASLALPSDPFDRTMGFGMETPIGAPNGRPTTFTTTAQPPAVPALPWVWLLAPVLTGVGWFAARGTRIKAGPT